MPTLRPRTWNLLVLAVAALALLMLSTQLAGASRGTASTAKSSAKGAAAPTTGTDAYAGAHRARHRSKHAIAKARNRALKLAVTDPRSKHPNARVRFTPAERRQLAGPDPDGPAFAHRRGPTGAGRPNIVLVMTDDMTASDLAYMPITRRVLAEQGVSFDRALSPHPLCCPARAAILTGQYAQNNGVKSNQPPFDYAALEPGTALPVWLHRAGYLTGFTGKYLNGFSSHGPRQPGWDYWDPSMMNQYAYQPFAMAENTNGVHWHYGENNVDYINNRVDSLVDRWAPRRKPFFIWASHIAPHGRIDPVHHISSTAKAYPPYRFLDRFTHAQSPSLKDPAVDEADVSDKNSLVRSKHPVSRQKINEVFRSRIRALQGVDQGVGQLVDHLRRGGVLDNTYIVFTSDNGFLLGEHRLLTKNVPYRQSIRVPLIMRGPHLPHGAHREQRALMIDLAPTFADIANAEPLVEVDGVSLRPAARRDAPLRTTVLIQAGPANQTDAAYGWWWRGVATNRYTYAAFFAEGREELYDHRYDPSETTNLAGDPAYADVLAELRRRTGILGSCAGAAQCSAAFPPLPEPTARAVIPTLHPRVPVGAPR